MVPIVTLPTRQWQAQDHVVNRIGGDAARAR
jgi:hypothetical protein